MGDGLAHRAEEVGAETVRAALVGGVAGGALLEHLLPRCRVGRGQEEGDRLLGYFALAFDLDAPERIAYFLAPFALEHLDGHERRAQRHDYRPQNQVRTKVLSSLPATSDNTRDGQQGVLTGNNR